jgi:hypothetical protein
MAEPSTDPMNATLRNVIGRADPVPPAVVEAARAAYTWRTVDAEIAELIADSTVASAGIRSSTPPRLLTFEAAGIEVEVEVAQTGTTRRLAGQVVPVGAAQVTVRWTDGTHDAVADELGRFTVDRIPAGPISLSVLRDGAEHPIVTSWVSI